MLALILALTLIANPNTINIVNLPYVSHEQLTGCATGRKTDIYSAGIILYELIVGAVPYMSNYSKVIMKALVSRNSRYLDVRKFIMELELQFVALYQVMRLSIPVWFFGAVILFADLFYHRPFLNTNVFVMEDRILARVWLVEEML